MPVVERNSACAIIRARRIINDDRVWTRPVAFHGHISIVDAIRKFIGKYPKLAGRRIDNIRLLEKASNGRRAEPPPIQFPGQAIVAESRIHRNTPDPRIHLAADSDCASIGRALVESGRLRVRRQPGESWIGKVIDIGVVAICAVEVQTPAHPRDIRDQPVLVLLAVGEIGELKLPEIMETTDALRFVFSFVQRGEEHSGEEPDDGRDNQQFNQREGSTVAARFGTPSQ